FEKFPGADGSLSTHMQSVGEAMAIGRTFKQAWVKARRSRELDVTTVPPEDTEELLKRLETPSHDRYELLDAAFERGVSDDELHRRTGIDPWFLAEIGAVSRGENPEAGRERSYKALHTSAPDFAAATTYFYSGWSAARRMRSTAASARQW